MILRSNPWAGRISGGLIDVAFASSATFLIGAYAVRYLEPEVLGAYGLFFSAFLLAALFPAQLLFVPAEVSILPLDERRQLATVPRSIRLSLPTGLTASVIVCALVPLAAVDVGRDELVALGLTTAVAAVLSPAQDHVRRVFHQCDRSSLAARTSVVQLVMVAAALAAWSAAGLSKAWAPFGALSVANLISIAFALVMVRRLSGRSAGEPLSVLELVGRGRWLLYSAVVERGSGLLALAVVSIVAGTAAAGFVEATRVLSQPVLIFGMGLMAVMRPPIMRAAQRRDRARARRITIHYFGAIGLGSAALIALIGFDWPGNPLVTLFAPAYEEPGLLALGVVGAAVGASTLIVRNEIIGAALEPRLPPISTTASVAMVATTAALVGPVGPYAIPIAIVARGIVLDVLQWRALHDHYVVGDAATRPDREDSTAS
ncbi:MAG: hypothetical protein AAGF02_16870 [Actinomycetota bacterium]